jgi:hypothetical protein
MTREELYSKLIEVYATPDAEVTDGVMRIADMVLPLVEAAEGILTIFSRAPMSCLCARAVGTGEVFRCEPCKLRTALKPFTDAARP